MSRSPQSITRSIRAKWPVGYAAPRRDGVLDAVYEGFAQEMAEGEAAVKQLFTEIHPRDSDILIGDFERVLGADPCARKGENDTLDQRQTLAWSRWVARGGASIVYFKEMAAKLGFDIEIEEFWPSIAGVMVAGDALIPEGEQFVWRVLLALTHAEWFLSGRNEAFEPLFFFQLSDLECVFNRLKPAHTTVVFSYQE